MKPRSARPARCAESSSKETWSRNRRNPTLNGGGGCHLRPSVRPRSTVTLTAQHRPPHQFRRTPDRQLPPSPRGTRAVTINFGGRTAGDFSVLRSLTLNGNVGEFAISPGPYGEFTANSSSGFTLGVATARRPSYTSGRITADRYMLTATAESAIWKSSLFTRNGLNCSEIPRATISYFLLVRLGWYNTPVDFIAERSRTSPSITTFIQ
jgi:hypothetical protein